ncbi:hypothetical protein PRIPAC_84820 [Pristionchus pacificus]|nr:hypothetical protein PRIPAC_84820 [Pristionchus pacificus]
MGEITWKIRLTMRREWNESTPFLGVHLEAKCEGRSKWSFSMLDSYSLISFNDFDDCHEVESEDITQYDERETSYVIDLIEMEELFTDRRAFVRCDSILLEIDVRVFENA